MRFKMISVRDLENYIDREDVLILDLREREAYEQGHMKGAIWADWESLESQIGEYLEAAEREINWIILYCERGNTSLLIARDLARLGYPVMSVNGGFAYYSKNME